MCWRCEGNVTLPDTGDAFISMTSIMNYPLAKGLELKMCKDEKDQGKQVQCPHMYDMCYKAWVECDNKKVFFRGCGKIATLGRDVVDERLRKLVFGPGEKPVVDSQDNRDSLVIQLPNSHFPSITGYMAHNGCQPRNETAKTHHEVGQLYMCDRVHCNHGQILTPVFHLKIHLLWIILHLLK